MLGTLLGMGMQIAGTLRQEHQAKKNAKQQVKYQKELAEHQQKLAMENWENTNYAAQIEQMKKAGVSPGLIYGMSGGGATLGATGSSGAASKADTVQTPDFMGMGLTAELQKAQIENIKADTTSKEIDNTNKDEGGIDFQGKTTAIGEATARIDKIKAETSNTELQTAIGTYQKDVAENQAKISNATVEDAIQIVKHQNDKLWGEAMSAMAKGNVDTDTQETVKRQINLNEAEQITRIAAQKAGIELTQQQIAKTVMEIDKVLQETGSIKAATEFNYGEEASWIRRIDTGSKAVAAGGKLLDSIVGALSRGMTRVTKSRTDKGDDWSETTTTTQNK